MNRVKKESTSSVWKMEVSSFRCAQCGSVFGSEMYLSRHEKTHQRIKVDLEVLNLEPSKISCQICGEQLKNASELEKHKSQKHTSEISNLECCGQIFTKLSELISHNDSEHRAIASIKQEPLDFDGETSIFDLQQSTEMEFENEILLKTVKSEPMEPMDEGYFDYANFEEVEEERRRRIEEVVNDVIDSVLLYRNPEVKHPSTRLVSPYFFKCTFCDLRFASMGQRIVHEKQQHRDADQRAKKIYNKCTYCNMELHTSIRNVCRDCRADRFDLGSGNQKCIYCNKKLSGVWQLIKHEIDCHQEDPKTKQEKDNFKKSFRCFSCSYRFSSQLLRIIHHRIAHKHLNSTKRKLENSTTKHTKYNGQNTSKSVFYSCLKCHEDFSTAIALSNHQRQMHPKNVPKKTDANSAQLHSISTHTKNWKFTSGQNIKRNSPPF